MFFLLYGHTDDGVIDDFAKISDHFPKISDDSPKFVRRSHERCRAFSENFRRLPKIAEDCRRLLRKTRRCFDHTPTDFKYNLRDKLDISKSIDILTSEDMENMPLELPDVVSNEFYERGVFSSKTLVSI